MTDMMLKYHECTAKKKDEDEFKCPDCDKPFAFVAPLYIHAATTHYNEQIKAKVFNI